jgi:hypothetical protein
VKEAVTAGVVVVKVGCPEQAIRLNNKTRNKKDFFTLIIA